jgi:hypothetical protein
MASKSDTLCDGHDVDFVTVTGQILMAVHKRAIQDRTIRSAPIASDLKDKLAEVAREEADRERHRNSGQRWPLNN